MQVDEGQFATGSGLRRQFAVGQEHPVVQRMRDLRQQRGPWPVAVWFVDRGELYAQFQAALAQGVESQGGPGWIGAVVGAMAGAGVEVGSARSGALPEGCPVTGGAGVWVVMSDGEIERLGIGD